MENKSNSLNRIKRQQREKVLRFSIRKYSFGAASVAVAALMFLGARVASADSLVDKTSHSTAGVVTPESKVESPQESTDTTAKKVDEVNKSLENKETAITENSAPTVDKTKLKKVVEELNALLSTKLNLDESVVSPVKDRLQKGKEALESSELAQKDIDELVELLSKDVTVVSAAKETTEVQVDKQVDNTEKLAADLASQSSPEVSASEEGQTVSAKKDALKVSVDQLKAAVLEVPAHETTKEVLEKANEVMALAQGVLENTTVSLNDVEQMNKLVKRMFNSVKNATTRLNSGARDSRNGQRMAQGTGFRATTTDDGRVEGALINVKEYISEPKGAATTTDNGKRDRTITKTFMTAKYSEENGRKYITYDVYFQNDGYALDGNARNAFWFYPPRDILHIDGGYPSGTLFDTYYERYRNNGSGGTLSHNPNNFTKVGDTYYVPSRVQDSSSERIWKDGYSFYQLDGGPSSDSKRQEMLKNLQYNSDLNGIIKPNGRYPGLSYSHVLTIASHTNYAYKYHVKMRLRDNVTADQAKSAGVMAVTTKAGLATNATAGYVYAALGSRLVTKPDAEVYPIKGKEVTTTVGASLGDVSNPVASNFVVRNDDSKDFPNGMSWEWLNGQPNTNTAGVFKPQAKATYSDHTSNTATATLIVKPKKPTITASEVEHKKGLPNQQITVNVGSGVEGSTVKLYDGDRVIGTGTAHGGTATITVKEALPGKPITSETVVNNGGTVTSDRSNPVIPTEAPDTQPPTLTVTPERQTVRVGENIRITIDGQDDTKVNLNVLDLLTKYSNHMAQIASPNREVDTATHKKYVFDLGAATTADLGEKTITFTVTDDARHTTSKQVTVTVIPATKENETHNPTATELQVEINHQLTDDEIKAKVTGYPTNATLVVEEKPETNTTGAKTAKVKVIYSDKSEDQVDVPITVRDTTPPKIYWVKDDGSRVELGRSHEEGQNIVIPLYRGDAVNTRLITIDNSGKVTNFKTENLQNGFSFTPVNGTATEGSPLGQSVTGTVGLGVGKGKYTARAISTDGTNTTTGFFVFDVHEQAEKYTPEANTLTVPFNHTITDDEVKGKVIAKPGTPAFPDGTIFEVISKPETNTPGTDKKAVVKITYPDKSSENINVPVHVGKDLASQYPLEGRTETVTVGDSLKTWNGSVDSNQYTNAPKGRGNGVKWGWKGTTPAVIQRTAGVFKYTATATHTDKSVAESNPQVTIIVKPKAPTIETDLTGKAELPNTAVVVNVHDGVKDGSIVTLYSQDGRAIGTGAVANGKATVTGTIPVGNITAKTTVQTSGEQDVTSDPSPEKAATTNKAALYPIKGKTATVTVGDSLRTWNGRVDANQYTDAGPNGKGSGVQWGWEGTAPTIRQDTAGVFKYTATATHTDNTVAKSDPQVTIIVKPKQPTITTDLTGKSNQENVPVTVTVGEGVKDGSIVTLYGPDGTTVIGTGTVTNGKATAIITGKVPVGNITAKTTVQTPGQDNVVSEPSPIKEATNIVPTAKTQTVGHKEQPIAKNSIGNNGDLPNGTGYTWKTTPDTSTPGDKSGIVTVTYPDGSTVDIPVTVTVTPQKDTYTPTPVNQTVGLNKTPEAKDSIGNKNNLPNGTTYVWKETPDTSTAGDKPAVVLVTYPDTTVDEVPVTVKVTQVSDDYTPQYNDGSGKPGSKVEIPVGEANGKTIPSGTTYTSETPSVITVDKTTGQVTVTIPSDKTPGDEVTGKVLVRYPDGSEEEVPVKVTVTPPEKLTPTIELKPDPKTGDVTVTPQRPGGGTYPPGTTVEIPGEDGPITVEIGQDGKGKVPNDKLPKKDVPGTGKITEPGKPAVEVPNVTTPPNVTIFENGLLPDSIELPELMIDVRWIDEDGNVLKSSVKSGNEKDAEHGSISGYEFVRTVIAENDPVLTHIFRKVGGSTNSNPVTPDTNGNSSHDTPELTTPAPIPVAPVTPDTNGGSGQDTPASTTPIPDAVTPNTDQVDTKTTVDNGAKSNDSQTVLPNTGTESNATLASLGLLGMLGGLGLAFGKKKED